MRTLYVSEKNLYSMRLVLELIKLKCFPNLLHGLDACPLNKTNLRSLDFFVNRFFIKLFKTIATCTWSQKFNWHLVLGRLVL